MVPFARMVASSTGSAFSGYLSAGQLFIHLHAQRLPFLASPVEFSNNSELAGKPDYGVSDILPHSTNIVKFIFW